MIPSLQIYNTATRSKELFSPHNDPVGMYCCGPTVYNVAHIGNLRTYIFEDVLKRTLLSLGYAVRHVINITDVGHLVSDADTGEDKMEKGAAREGRSVWDIAAYYTQKFMTDISDLNILKPDLFPKATDHIPPMIKMVGELERRGFTYRTGDGIYFDTLRFPSYAAFARLDPASIRAGERVDMGEKRSPMDFALWKFSPKDAKRQMEWESPWGAGFPGWHIECSAMALAYLAQPVDIHCGGSDHVRVHHTNEIAQAEAATGRPFVKYWLHGEFLVVDKGKMAKSGENFVSVDSLKEAGIPPLAYRLFCYSAHYRSPLTYSTDGVRAAATSLANLRKALAGDVSADTAAIDPASAGKALIDFYAAVYDDLNMPRAMAALWDIVRDEKTALSLRRAAARKADEILGLDLLNPFEETAADTFAGENGTSIRLVCGRELSGREKLEIADKVR
ncbi:MAG: cysteine--tRNA ligase, partial [Chitinispirillaceae bacterium]|nr:cysteine--tRNA ligase [Chitinispirillaceae bacterium]